MSEQKKSKKKLIAIIASIIGIIIIAITAIFVINSNNIPTDKPENTKPVKEETPVLAIIDGKEVKDYNTLAKLTDNVKIGYYCLGNKENKALFWSDINQVPEKYRRYMQPFAAFTGSTERGEDFSCEYYNTDAASQDALKFAMGGIWNETTQTYDIKPLPKEYDNWYSQSIIEAYREYNALLYSEPVFSFSKTVEIYKADFGSNDINCDYIENKCEDIRYYYIMGFLAVEKYRIFIFRDGQYLLGNYKPVSELTPEEQTQILEQVIDGEKNNPITRTNSDGTITPLPLLTTPEQEAAYRQGFNDAFLFAKSEQGSWEKIYEASGYFTNQ